VEQLPLALPATAVAGEITGGPYDTVTRNDHADGIATVREAHRPCSAGLSDLLALRRAGQISLRVLFKNLIVSAGGLA
jgi:hypothetical protein